MTCLFNSPGHLRLLVSIVVTLTFAPAAMAQAARVDPVRELAPVQVSTSTSGPYVWEFSRAGKRVLVLGTVLASSQSVDYVPDRIERAVGESDVVLGSPGVVVGEGIGLLRGLTLWSSIRNARYLPASQRLVDVMPPDLYGSWQRLKLHYLGDDAQVERMLPMYAAWRLHEAMLKKTGLSDDSQVRPPIARLAAKRGIPILDAQFHMPIGQPKRAIQQFRVPAEQDLDCFRSALAAIEAIPHASAPLMDAWASGDVTAMISSLASYRYPDYCWARLTNEAIARQQGISLDDEMRDAWHSALNKALGTGDVIFTTAPVSDLVTRTGRVRWLVDAGFRQTDPVPDDEPR